MQYIQEAYFNNRCRPYKTRHTRWGCERIHEALCVKKKSSICRTKNSTRSRRIPKIICKYLPRSLKRRLCHEVHFDLPPDTRIPTQFPTQFPTHLQTQFPTHLPTQFPTHLDPADHGGIGGFKFDRNSCWVDSILFLLRYVHHAGYRLHSKCPTLSRILELGYSPSMISTRHDHLRDAMRLQLLEMDKEPAEFMNEDAELYFDKINECLTYRDKRLPCFSAANMIMYLEEKQPLPERKDVDEFFFIPRINVPVISYNRREYALRCTILHTHGDHHDGHFIVHYATGVKSVKWLKYDDLEYVHYGDDFRHRPVEERGRYPIMSFYVRV